MHTWASFECSVNLNAGQITQLFKMFSISEENVMENFLLPGFAVLLRAVDGKSLNFVIGVWIILKAFLRN